MTAAGEGWKDDAVEEVNVQSLFFSYRWWYGYYLSVGPVGPGRLGSVKKKWLIIVVSVDHSRKGLLSGPGPTEVRTIHVQHPPMDLWGFLQQGLSGGEDISWG